MLSETATHTKFRVFGLTWSGLDPMIYHTRGENANQKNTPTMWFSVHWSCFVAVQMFVLLPLALHYRLTTDILYGVRLVFIFSINQSTMIFKTEYMPRAVFWLVNIFNCLAYDWTVKDGWKVTWHDPYWDVVIVSVSPKNTKLRKDTTKI